MYVYGKSFVLESDHKPLEMINVKNLAAAPQRLQRMFLRVQPYDFVLRCKPGKQMMLAEAMSRQPSSESTQIDLDIQVSFVQFSTQKLQSIREATQADDELCALRAVIVDGSPDSQRHLAAPLRPYWSCRDELAVEDGLIMKGDSGDSPKSTDGSVEQTARGSPGHREDPAASEVLCLLEVDQQGHRRHREEVRRVSTIT